MFEYFLERVRGWRVFARVLAPIVWFQTTLLMTGVYARYTAAQAGRPLEEMPFFSGETAAERLGAISASGAAQTAFAFYAIDVVNAILLGAGFAALIGFGLRSLRVRSWFGFALLLGPLALVCADIAENAALAAALAVSDHRVAIGGIAGYATGAKLIFFALAALLAVLGAIAGIGVWVRRSLRREPRHRAAEER